MSYSNCFPIIWTASLFRVIPKANRLYFAASKKHIGLYPGPAAVEEFAEELTNYKTDKGTIRIPYGNVDAELIKKIAAWCCETGNHA